MMTVRLMQTPGCFYLFCSIVNLLLMFKYLRRQDDLVCGYFFQPKDLKDLFTILKRKNIIRAFVSQIRPCIGVDVAHHKVDLLLGVLADIDSFGNASADHFMVVLAAAFLVRSIGFTVIHACPAVALPVKLNGFGIGELATIVSKKDREEIP